MLTLPLRPNRQSLIPIRRSLMKNPLNLPPRRRNRLSPCLTFAPLAWLKLQFFCHAGDTEIGGFGISAADNLPLHRRLCHGPQQVTSMTVHFADDAVADYFDGQVDRGLPPQRFSRIWCHTHPGASQSRAAPDEETFDQSFGRCEWAVMFILGRPQHYARLALAAVPAWMCCCPRRGLAGLAQVVGDSPRRAGSRASALATRIRRSHSNTPRGFRPPAGTRCQLSAAERCLVDNYRGRRNWMRSFTNPFWRQEP